MAFLQGKTPISFLQELCTKRGITPQYDLIANEGAVHEPTFVFKVTGGEFVGTGKGTSKKKAKQNAALSVLNQMMGIATNGQTVVEDSAVSQSVSSVDGGSGNPVGELQELTQKNLWAPPVYDFTSEQGPPHAREFVCTVKLGRLTEQGVGKSKKIAKRNGADSMLTLLQQGGGNPGTAEDGLDEYDQPVPLTEGGHSAYSALKEGKRVPTLTPHASQQISQFYQGLKAKTGNHLSKLQAKTLSGGNLNFCQMLQDIAEEQRFEVTYVDLPDLSNTGMMQCLVQLSSLPVAVCHGVGNTTDEARASAAHNSLHYLKIMTKKA